MKKKKDSQKAYVIAGLALVSTIDRLRDLTHTSAAAPFSSQRSPSSSLFFPLSSTLYRSAQVRHNSKAWTEATHLWNSDWTA